MTLDPIALATKGYVCNLGPDDISIALKGYECLSGAVGSIADRLICFKGRFNDTRPLRAKIKVEK